MGWFEISSFKNSKFKEEGDLIAAMKDWLPITKRNRAALGLRLRDTKEGDGNKLDRTVVIWGSSHPHASQSTKNSPLHLAGGNKHQQDIKWLSAIS